MSRPHTPAWRIGAHPTAGLERREEFEAAAARAGAPARFYCPMSNRILQDPVTLSTGQSFERRYIERWLQLEQTTCPCTGVNLPEPVTFTVNTPLRLEIDTWCRENVHLPACSTPDAIATITSFSVDGGTAKSSLPNGGQDDWMVAMDMQEEELDVYHTKSRLPRIRTRNRSAPTTPAAMSSISGVETPRGSNLILKHSLKISLALASAAYITLYVLSLWKADWKLESINLNPLVGPNRVALASMGSLVNALVQNNNQWWRIPSSLFVSSGVIQLFCSLVCLWTLALHLEKSQRLWRPALTVPGIFIVCGLTGAITSVNLGYDLDSTGSSAGVCTLLGAVLMEQLTSRKNLSGRVLTIVVLSLLIAVFAVLSLLPLVGMWYSATAFVCGALLLPLALKPPRARENPGRQVALWTVKIGLAGLVLALLVLAILSIVLDQSRTVQDCPFCRQANCVQIKSWWQCSPQPVVPSNPTACQFYSNSSGTTNITCPSGSSQIVATSQLGDRNAACNQVCRASPVSQLSSLPPGNAGVLI